MYRKALWEWELWENDNQKAGGRYVASVIAARDDDSNAEFVILQQDPPVSQTSQAVVIRKEDVLSLIMYLVQAIHYLDKGEGHGHSL